MDAYVELRCKSAFSFLDGASLPEDLVTAGIHHGFSALGLVDRDGFYGAPRFFNACKRHNESPGAKPLRPLLGAELTLDSGGSLTLLVEDRAGYRRLSRLVTRARMDVDATAPTEGKVEPRVTSDMIAADAGGLVALTGGADGAVARALDAGDAPAADRALATLVELFGRERVFVEVQRHFDADEEVRLGRLVALARRHRLPLVATNDVRYATPDLRRLHDVLVCARHKATVDEIGRRLPRTGERWLKPPAAMARLFRDLPDAIENTRAVAERCAFTLADLGYEFPDCDRPEGVSLQSHLENLTWNRAQERFRPLDEKTRAQLQHELRIIGRLDLAGYFLIVSDIVDHCRRRNILAQGRGSAANSAVCYALGITAVDPVKMELLFERFLSEERGEWPDIDIDLPSGDRREEIIQYVYKKYGAARVGMTANVITYRPRMAVRDVGRALGFSEEQLGRMSRVLPSWGFSDSRDTIAKCISEAGFSTEDERTRLLVELSDKMLGLPRHLGQHSGGLCIARGRLDEVVPLEPASMPGRVVIQWDKEDCADLGIIKIDLLGLGMMAVLADSIPLIRESEGIEIDLAHLPAGDAAVYDMLCKADTVGVFQVESRAQMATLPRMKPRTFYDLVIEVAIIRPGPIVGDLLHPYLRRRMGKEPADPLHPSLKQALDRTLGVPLFQEQLMKVAMIAAGFSGGEAEELRRAMGFKRSEARMVAIAEKLLAGMARNGITGATADRVVQWITAFAAYGFPESHAASFALIVYASAYLKAHHPAAFCAALLNNYPMGFYSPATLVRDAQHHDVEVRPIDVDASDWLCTLETKINDEAPALRVGLRYVKGLGEDTAKRIVAARRQARFASVGDLAARAGLGRVELARLAEVGALASLEGRGRRAALWQVERVGRSGPLFAAEHVAADSPLDEMTERESLAADYAIAGLSTARHPMALRRAALDAAGVVAAADLARLGDGRRVRVAGHVIVRQRPGTAKGFFFVTLEDETGLANLIVTPKHFDAHRALLVGAPALVVDGVLQQQEGTTSIRADRFVALDEVTAGSHDFH